MLKETKPNPMRREPYIHREHPAMQHTKNFFYLS